MHGDAAAGALASIEAAIAGKTSPPTVEALGIGRGLAAARGVVGQGGSWDVDEDRVAPGARRSRRSASLGHEQDGEVDSPPPPSKRYRNNTTNSSSSTKTRIACFPAVEVRKRRSWSLF